MESCVHFDFVVPKHKSSRRFQVESIRVELISVPNEKCTAAD